MLYFKLTFTLTDGSTQFGPPKHLFSKMSYVRFEEFILAYVQNTLYGA